MRRPAGLVERAEEGKTLNVVAVDVRQQQVDVLLGRKERLPERTDARTRVEDQDGIVALDADAGRVSAVAAVDALGRGDRASGSPYGDGHALGVFG